METRKPEVLAVLRELFETRRRAYLKQAANFLRSPEDAEDAVQDACLRAVRYCGRLRLDDGQAGVDRWFRGILTTSCIQIWRRRRRPDYAIALADEELTAILDHASDANNMASLLETMLFQDGVRHGLALVMGDLDEMEQAILKLYLIEGHSRADVARQLGLGTVDAVDGRVRRLRAKLREGLGDIGNGSRD